MLRYQNIHAVNLANHRLASGRRNLYGLKPSSHRETDQLTVFTLGTAAATDSRHNLDWLLKLGTKYDQQYLIFTDRKIQMLGEIYTHTDVVMNRLAPTAWQQEFEDWGERGLGRVRKHAERTGLGGLAQINTYKRCWAATQDQGVYEVSTGKKITNRRDIIQAFWDLGFASLRGRPLTVATMAMAGERCDIELVQDLAEQNWHKRDYSEAARKMCSNFTSLNRVAAWPGAW